MTYEGFLPTDQLQAEVGQCAAVLMTSKWVEAFGNVAIEAMNRTEKRVEIKSFATDSAQGDGSVVALPNQVLLPPIPLYLRKPDALTLAERA